MKSFDLYEISLEHPSIPVRVLEIVQTNSTFINKNYFKSSNFIFLGFEIQERKSFHFEATNYLKFLNLSTGVYFLIPEPRLSAFIKIV